jgi:hypothetical protein
MGVMMSRFFVLGVGLAILAAGTITTAFKLHHRPALASTAKAVDPAILKEHLQKSQEQLALP